MAVEPRLDGVSLVHNERNAPVLFALPFCGPVVGNQRSEVRSPHRLAASHQIARASYHQYYVDVLHRATRSAHAGIDFWTQCGARIELYDRGGPKDACGVRRDLVAFN